MTWLRWPLSGLRWAMLLIPALAVTASAIADFGPSGEIRVSWFPLALGVNDPILLASLRNSLIAGALTALGARQLGMALARATGRWRFWGRDALFLLALLPIALPPSFGAIGWMRLFQSDGPVFTAASRLSLAEPVREALRNWHGWAGLVWLGIASGAPIVALSVRQVLDRIEPTWEESAFAAGGSRRQVWRQLVRPLARRQANRVAMILFVLTLAEPGAALVLGLRETVGFQIVEAASVADGGSASRLAVLAASWGVVVALIALAARPRRDLIDLPRPAMAGRSARRAGYLRASALNLSLIAWTVLAVAPLVGLIAAAFDLRWSGGLHGSSAAFFELPRDDALVWALLRSLGVATAAAASWMFAREATSVVAVNSAVERKDRFQRGVESLSPLTLGAGLVLLSYWLRTSGAPGFAVWRGIDGDATPILVCAWAAALWMRPHWRDIAAALRNRDRAELREAAVLAGAPADDARRMGRGGRRIDPWLSALALTMALTIVYDGPQQVICQTGDSRLLGPEIVHRASRGLDDSATTRAAAAACLIVVLNLAAYSLAAASRIAPAPGLKLRDSSR